MNKADCILRWHGSKRQLVPAIVKLFPPDYEKMVYVEAFCGGAAVYFVKHPSRSEVLNDLDGDLVNVLLTIKFHPHELVRCLRLLPNSRALFAEALDAGARFSSIIRAARFLYLSAGSFGGLREHWAPAARHGKPWQLDRFRIRVWRWAKRLSRTCLECAPWQEIIEKYDSPQALFYLDPPYPEREGYARSFGWAEWRELHARLDRLQGKFVLSGPGNARMRLLWRGYHQRRSQVTSTLAGANRASLQKELLVWNY